MLYPILFEPIYKEMVWGGSKFKKFGRDIPFERTGESWDISCRENEMGIVKNGRHKGKTFIELINTDKTKILGDNLKGTSINFKNFRADLAQAAPLASKRSRTERKYHYLKVP